MKIIVTGSTGVVGTALVPRLLRDGHQVVAWVRDERRARNRLSQWEGDGIKLGYEGDTGRHEATRCLSWNNHCHGWTVRGGPYMVYNSAAYNNAEDGYSGISNNSSNMRRNTYGFLNSSGNGAGAEDYSGISISEDDFVSMNDDGMLGPRRSDGGLPEPDFLKPVLGGNLVDVGVDVGIPYESSAPEVGPFEYSAE